MPPQEKGPGDQITLRGTTNLLYFAAQSLATVFSVFLRRDFGTEALGMNGAVAFLIILFAWGADDSGWMKWFFWAWLFMLAFQRMKTTGNERKGRHQHSRYPGFPYLAMRLPLVKREYVARGAVEPLLLFLAGSFVAEICPTLCLLMVASAGGMLLAEGMDNQITQRRVQRHRDAHIEGMQTAEMFRGQRY